MNKEKPSRFGSVRVLFSWCIRLSVGELKKTVGVLVGQSVGELRFLEKRPLTVDFSQEMAIFGVVFLQLYQISYRISRTHHALYP